MIDFYIDPRNSLLFIDGLGYRYEENFEEMYQQIKAIQLGWA